VNIKLIPKIFQTKCLILNILKYISWYLNTDRWRLKFNRILKYYFVLFLFLVFIFLSVHFCVFCIYYVFVCIYFKFTCSFILVCLSVCLLFSVSLCVCSQFSLLHVLKFVCLFKVCLLSLKLKLICWLKVCLVI